MVSPELSSCRVGIAPTEDQHIFTAHSRSDPMPSGPLCPPWVNRCGFAANSRLVSKASLETAARRSNFFARRFDRPPNVLHSCVDVSAMADWLAPAPFAIRISPVCSDSHLILFPGISCTAGAAVPQARWASRPRLAAHIISGKRITRQRAAWAEGCHEVQPGSSTL